MSTTLDRADVEYLVEESLSGLLQSRFWNGEIRTMPVPPVFAIWPIENATSEHVEDQMQILLSSIETTLVNSGDVEVVARARQSALAREIGIQEGAAFDPMEAARFGRQLGAQYFVTGKLMAVDERLQKTRRVQYSLFVQVLEIETGLVKFQHETGRSKALQR